jgi:hypothetical protein
MPVPAKVLPDVASILHLTLSHTGVPVMISKRITPKLQTSKLQG